MSTIKVEMQKRTLFLIAPGAFHRHSKSRIEGGAPTGPGLVFGLAEYVTAFSSCLIDMVDLLAEEKAPILKEIPRETVESVSAHHVTTETGATVSIVPGTSSFPIETDVRDVADFDVERLESSIDLVAERQADSVMQHLLASATQVTDATGNSESAGGAPFDWSVLLRALSKIQIDFDDRAQPIMPRLIFSDQPRRIVPYPELSGAERKEFEALIERKRDEFNARIGRN